MVFLGTVEGPEDDGVIGRNVEKGRRNLNGPLGNLAQPR
jgi:hypothetical protein